ncbi:uncharacterized protein LOC125034630 [Penaeus chinensis]|uniref:uncharacterized protein LOC125034630 n=1 Tax=Penaeus chinensis TaxID=139456 RepID=UPI001FB84D5C|nr:uncharacterized protein LOC125034630 [Penaeus chinensis]
MYQMLLFKTLSPIQHRTLFISVTKPTQPNPNSEVVNQLNNSAPGYDGITAPIINSTLPAISRPLLHLCNTSLTKGIYPDKLKTAKVTQVHKSGCKTNIHNYRSVSVMLVISKILEKIIYIRLENYLTRNSILSDCQFGFIRNISTGMAVMSLTNHIYKTFDTNEFTIAVSLDLSKASDIDNPPILLSKLSHYGVRGSANRLVHSYMSNRNQFVSSIMDPTRIALHYLWCTLRDTFRASTFTDRHQ